MEITVNGEKEEIDAGLSIRQYIQQKGQNPQKVVVEYNGQIVKRKEWEDLQLQQDDTLEVLKFMGGGAR